MPVIPARRSGKTSEEKRNPTETMLTQVVVARHEKHLRKLGLEQPQRLSQLVLDMRHVAGQDEGVGAEFRVRKATNPLQI